MRRVTPAPRFPAAPTPSAPPLEEVSRPVPLAGTGLITIRCVHGGFILHSSRRTALKPSDAHVAHSGEEVAELVRRWADQARPDGG